MNSERNTPTDAAVKAALTAWLSKEVTGINLVEDMRAALIAALPHLQTGYKIKQLEWSDLGCVYEADLYRIVDGGPNRDKDRFDLWYNKEVLQGVFGTLDEAKSAAQEDFEDNVRECIVGGNNG